MPISTLTDAKTFEADGFTLTQLAAPSKGSVELALWTAHVEPGARSVEHRMDREEVFLVVSGTVAASLNGEEIQAAAGDAIIVPPGSLLQLRNETAEPAGLTCVTSVGLKATANGETFAPPWTL